MDLPKPVQEHLKLLFVKSRFPAFLFITHDGNLSDWGGYCDRYGLTKLIRDKPAGDQVDFVESMVTVHGYINRWHQEIQVFYLGKNKKSKKSHFFRDSHGIIVYLVS